VRCCRVFTVRTSQQTDVGDVGHPELIYINNHVFGDIRIDDKVVIGISGGDKLQEGSHR